MSQAVRYSQSPWWGSVSFGGLPKGRSAKTNPKIRRPLSSRTAIHLVMRSESARGRYNMRNGRNLAFVQNALSQTAKRYRIKLHKTANVGNHLHILASALNRRLFICFTRRLAALIAIELKDARKDGEPFWTGRPFTRIVLGGVRGFWRTESYVILNELEALGILPPRAIARLGPAGFGRRMKLLKFARKVANAKGL